MPTLLPLPPKQQPRAAKKSSIFDFIFNGFLVVSALALTFVVLMQEQRFAMGQPGPFAETVAQLMQAPSPDTTGESLVILPAD